MNTIKIHAEEDFIGEAPNVSGTGKIKFKLCVNENNELYIQLEDNENAGTYSDRAFPVFEFVDKYLADGALDTTSGYDVSTERIVRRTGSNDAGFLKAVLRRLLPDK